MKDNQDDDPYATKKAKSQQNTPSGGM